MKVILALVFLAGCSTGSYKTITSEVAENGLQVYEGKTDKCYIYRDSDGSTMSCLKKD